MEIQAVAPVLVAPARAHRDWVATLLGAIVFFAGVALLLLTFDLAYHLFTQPPASALGMTKGQPIDLAKAGNSATNLLLRIVLLVLMAFVGSTIANRGISLYSCHHNRPR